MRDQSSHVTMTHEQAVKTLLEHCDFDQQTETIPLIEAYHRVLAEDIVAKQDKPNCLTCLMDSVAVHWDDFENGMPDTSGWERGKQWEFANTGIGMPEGFDTRVAPGGRIVVTTVDEFLAAIGPDRTIVLQGETFSLAKAANYGGEAGRYYRWEECYDGPQLVITGAADLTICAEGTDPAATTLTATPRYADVLAFMGCDNVTVSGLTLGHTDGPSECAGAVLNFENCVGITVDRCRLYGCGTMGVNASYARDLKVTDTEIYDCSISGAVLYGVRGAAFLDCRIHDVPSPMLCLYDCSDVAWNGSPVLDTYYDVTPDGELVPVAIG